MAKEARIGELHTRIYVRKVVKKTDADGIASKQKEESVFAPGSQGRERAWHCKWVNAYGTQVLSAMQFQIQEPATLTMRYSPNIQPDQLIYKIGDPIPFEIISVNDVEARHRWLEVKVCRRRAAR